MKYLLMMILLAGCLVTHTASARTVEVEVHGLTCSFCVDSLERKFGKVDSISKIEISLKNKKVRLQTVGDQPTLEFIKQTVLEAGFTPTKITEIEAVVE